MKTSLTADFKITDGTSFIVFDMEWNQPFPGKEYSFDASKLTGEIIEIGAVKYTYENGAVFKVASFSENVRPQFYTKLHYHVRKLTHKSDSDLMKGILFSQAYTKFKEFCGDDCILTGWGTSDPEMLKLNLNFTGIDNSLKIPFLDLQPVFSRFSGEKGRQRSVEFAVDYYGIGKDDTFHSAAADAEYTALVLKSLFEHVKTSELLSIITSSLIDPDVPHEFSFVGQETSDVPSSVATAKDFLSFCPLCKKPLEIKIKQFRIRKSAYSLYACPEHGEYFARVRVRKTKASGYMASAVIRFATQADYYLIADKSEEFAKFGSRGAPALAAPAKTEDSESTNQADSKH